jgi:pyridinium-3,5-biscarboxylic acid mononucleotide sulfurtransferase
LIDRFKSFGFLYVTLDLEGYRSGKLNDVLNFKAPTTSRLGETT